MTRALATAIAVLWLAACAPVTPPVAAPEITPETAPERVSTASPGVSVFADAFALPRLGRTRRVWLYLPPDYATSGRRYPVLYLHDGQNAFDAATSFAGEWGVDETLDARHAVGGTVPIVVAVENGGAVRRSEYSPWIGPPGLGGGEGDAWLADLVFTLKPAVDARLRTLPDRAHTSVAGSSMGGLISLVALLRYPDVFGAAGAFSPALWFARDSVEALAARAGPPRPGTRLLLTSGSDERDARGAPGTGDYAADQRRLAAILGARGWGAALDTSVVAGGTHSESAWRVAFARWAGTAFDG